jgi:hypothetical protein
LPEQQLHKRVLPPRGPFGLFALSPECGSGKLLDALQAPRRLSQLDMFNQIITHVTSHSANPLVRGIVLADVLLNVCHFVFHYLHHGFEVSFLAASTQVGTGQKPRQSGADVLGDNLYRTVSNRRLIQSADIRKVMDA